MKLRRAAILIGVLFILTAHFAFLPRILRADTLTITSTPSGATVEMNGVSVGKTPYTVNMPGAYFHKPHTSFGARLEHPVVVRISLDGYTSAQLTITEGPYAWHSLLGRAAGDYFLLKTNHFDVTLESTAKIFTGAPDIRAASTAAAAAPTSTPLTVEAVASQANPAIVRIEGDLKRGTGFFVTDTGLIATNKHVVGEQSELYVVTHSKVRLPARVVYTDPDVDLAIVKVDGNNFPHLPLAAIDSVQRGETVIAIGDPGGGFADTLTRGVVSGIGVDRGLGDGTWIQTDATINPGNSGGPLLDTYGRVVGITALSRIRNNAGEDVTGLNFALSAENLIRVLRRFYPETEEAKRPADAGGYGSVSVSSDPAGADIYLDGKFVGNTPSMLHLPAGAHKIQIQAAKTKTWERDLDVLKDSEITVHAMLETQKN
ncbi:MAG TPA: trypsin-like peptidase domain-containing protein [Candidatus Acidoferrales bacterium]|nr:trypsin-like peptidase domain-containing protein [Candidatus Acidoferrales bacterium]